MSAQCPPPRYSSLPGANQESLPPYSIQPFELPSGSSQLSQLPKSSRSPPVDSTPHLDTEHTFQLMTSKNKPWATMNLYSRARTSKSLPTFQEGDSIDGSLALSFEKSDAIVNVRLLIQGRVMLGSLDTDIYTFFEQSKMLWNKLTGTSREGANENGKLCGGYLWPFRISVPKSFSPPDASSGDLRQFYLPQTFSEKFKRVSIQYHLTVVITRGKLRSNAYLTSVFAYVPLKMPEPLSLLRRLAYERNIPLSGPEDDPEGWETLPSVAVQGSLYDGRHAVLLCTLSLAKPLCYTRGSVIPCFLELECNDSLALDLLSVQTSLVVRLQRRLRCSISKDAREDQYEEAIDDLQTAVWWPSEGSHRSRQMSGEIQLETNLKPSTSIPHFSVTYTVTMSPLEAPIFMPSDSRQLLAETVEIVNAYVPGTRPRSLCPPGHKKPEREKVLHHRKIQPGFAGVYGTNYV